MTRRRPRLPGRRPGRIADFTGDCWCGRPIEPGQRIVPKGDGWQHVGCANGANDE